MAQEKVQEVARAYIIGMWLFLILLVRTLVVMKAGFCDHSIAEMLGVAQGPHLRQWARAKVG